MVSNFELNKDANRLMLHHWEQKDWPDCHCQTAGEDFTSKATATRDLQDLIAKNIFKPIGGGRSTRYELRIS